MKNKIQVKMTLTLVIESDTMSKEKMMEEAKVNLNDLVGLGLATGVITSDQDMFLEEHDLRIEYATGTI